MTKHDAITLFLLFLLVIFLSQLKISDVPNVAQGSEQFIAAVPVAGGPFGGAITELFMCVNGTRITVGPPVGGLFMYIPGTSFSYAFGPPRRVGQWLLGISGGMEPCLVPCESGLCPFGFGNVIIFHGSSK